MFLEAKMQMVHKILIVSHFHNTKSPFRMLYFPKSLSSATAFGYASIYLTRFEYQGDGIQWSTLFQTIFPKDQMNFGLACLMMLIDSILYGLIGKYVRSILPGKNARRKPFWYPCLPSTWCAWKSISKSKQNLEVEREYQPNPFTVRMKRRRARERKK